MLLHRRKIILLAAAAMLLAGRCWAEETGARVLRVGFLDYEFPGVDLRDARVATDIWFEKLIQSANANTLIESFIYTRLSDAVEAMKAQRVDAVSMGSLDYLDARDQFAIEPLLAGIYEADRETDEYLLVVHKDAGIRTLSDLRDRKLLLPQRSRIPRTWLDVILMEEGLPPAEQSLEAVIPTHNPSQAVLPVFFRQSDAAIVTHAAYQTIVELNPQVGEELVALKRSPGFLVGLLACRPNLDSELKRLIRDSAELIHKDPEGRQMLLLFRINRVVQVTPSLLVTVRALRERYHALITPSATGSG